MEKETLKKLFAEMQESESRLILTTEETRYKTSRKYYAIVYKNYLDTSKKIATLSIATFNINDYENENYISSYFYEYNNEFIERYYLINNEIYIDDVFSKNGSINEDVKKLSTILNTKNEMLYNAWQDLKNSYTKEKLIEFWNSKDRYNQTILYDFVKDETILKEIDKRIKKQFNKLNEIVETTENITCKTLINFNLVDYILLTDDELKTRYLKVNEENFINYSSDIQELYYKLVIDEKEKEIKESYIKENQERFNFIEKLSNCFKLIYDNNYKSVKITLKDDSIIQLKETEFYSLNNIIEYEEISTFNFKVIQDNGLKTYGYNNRVDDVSIYDIKKIEYSKKVLFENQ